MNRMTYQEAEAVVVPAIAMAWQYQAVPLSFAQGVLPADAFEEMTHDPVRGLGPVEGFVYPWNVAAYLSGYRRSVEMEQRRQRALLEKHQKQKGNNSSAALTRNA